MHDGIISISAIKATDWSNKRFISLNPEMKLSIEAGCTQKMNGTLLIF